MIYWWLNITKSFVICMIQAMLTFFRSQITSYQNVWTVLNSRLLFIARGGLVVSFLKFAYQIFKLKLCKCEKFNAPPFRKETGTFVVILFFGTKVDAISSSVLVHHLFVLYSTAICKYLYRIFFL